MMHLRPDETRLAGAWEIVDGAPRADAVARRIDALTAGPLTRVAALADRWSNLYRDARDGRHWELTYPESHLHGGGPPMLSVVPPEEFAARYPGIWG